MILKHVDTQEDDLVKILLSTVPRPEYVPFDRVSDR